MKTLRFFALLLCITSHIQAATWFVDNAAAGANNGTSWANAWTSFAAINWGAIFPGDFVYISGGPSGGSKIYSGTLTIGKNGTSGQRITIGVKADDAAHNGVIDIPGNYIEMSGRSYVTLTGNVNGDRRLALRDFFNTNIATFANTIMAPSTTGCKFDSLSFSNVNNCINLQEGTGFWVTNCIAIQTRGDAVIRAASAFGASYEGGGIIENCDFEVAVNSIDGGGPDGIQTGNNITARNNTFRVRRITGYYTSNQHPDMFQCPGVFLAIYNNDFINVGDSCIALGAWWAGSVHQHIRIYNNIFRVVSNVDPFPEFIRLYNGAGPIADISDLVIANNLFIDNPTWVNVLFTQYGPGGANPTGSGNFIVNNIWYNSGSGACWRLDQSTAWTPATWTINGNLYWPPGNSFVQHYGTTFGAAAWVAANEPQGGTGQPIFASYTANSIANNLHLSGSDTAARNTGVDLSSFFTIDKDGLTRSVPWDKGPYEYPSSGQSVIEVAQAAYTVSEGDANAVLTFRRTGTVNGVVGATVSTANGTATSGVNYTGGSQFVSWPNGDGTDKTVSIPLINTSMTATKTFTAALSNPTGGAVLGAQTSTTVSITGTGTPGEPLLSGWGPWPAPTGVIAAPFTVAGGSISQSTTTDDPSAGGSARYTFTNSPGDFRVILEINAPSGANNSVFADMNTQPTQTAIFDVVVLTSGYENRLISWRGTGTFETPEFSPKVWTLAGGTNTLIIRGREADTLIKTVTIDPVIPPDPEDPDPVAPTVVSVTSTMTPGFYKTNIVVPITVTWSTNATVTGTPRIRLNSTGFANYVSGSGTTEHLYNYTIAAGQNTQLLEYTSTSALELNGGTIRNLTTDAVVLLPTPGSAGSLSQSTQVGVDTIQPAIGIAGAVVSSDVRYLVNYSDLNLLGQSLNSTNVVANYTGTLTGSVSIENSGQNSATVVISNLNGQGTVTCTINPGTAADTAGNLAASAQSPAATFEMTIMIIRSGRINEGAITR